MTARASCLSFVRVLVILCMLVGIASADRIDPSAHDSRGPTADEIQIADGYRFGRRIKLKLAPVDWTYLDVRTARDYKAMQAAALADGVELYIRSGFRSHERQIALYARWKAGWGNRAAKPGFSLHQSGRALDLYVGDERTREWLAKHAKQYGFRRTVGDEPWHFEHTPGMRRIAKRPAKASAKTRPTAQR